MKRVVRVVMAILILAILVAGTVFILKYAKESKDNNSGKNTEFVSEEIGVLPTVSTICDGQTLNSLHGYTMDMDLSSMHDNLATVFDYDRNLKIKINTNGVEIKDISYVIEDFAGKEVIADEQVTDYTAKKEKITFTLSIPKEAGLDEEWMMVIKLVTLEDVTVNYYTRVECLTESYVDSQVDFISSFSETTLDYNAAMDLIGYIEPDSNYDNTNLGTVTINSAFSQLTWGNMEITRITDPVITLKEMDYDVGSYELTYMVMSNGDYGEVEYYNVTEFFRVWSYLGETFLRSYNRSMEQVFEASSSTISKSRVNLGIQKKLDIDFIQSPSGQYIAYVLGDSLWCIDLDNYAATNIYSIERNATDNIKDSAIECISVDDDGNIEFTVYGYMNTAVHMGKSGICAYSYNNEKGEVTERIFIEYDHPYEILQDEIGELYYIADGVLYMFIDSSISYVNLTTKECGQIVKNLTIGTFAVNDDMNLLAFNEEGSAGNADSITIMNFDTGEIQSIEAGEGEKISVCDYVGDDLIYGIANEDEITDDGSGNITFPMKAVYIVNDKLETLQTYKKKNVRVTDVEIKGTLINLTRTKNGESISDDQLLETAEATETAASVSYITTDLKEKQLVLTFTNNCDTSEKLVVTGATVVETTENTNVELSIPKLEQKKFYVYINGELSDVYQKKKTAIKAAKSGYGVVVNNQGKKIWAYEETY